MHSVHSDGNSCCAAAGAAASREAVIATPMEMGVWPMETCLAYACRHSIAWLVVAPHLPVARIARSEIWGWGGWGFADTAFPAASRLPGAKRRAAGPPAFWQNEIPLKKHTNSSTSSHLPEGREGSCHFAYTSPSSPHHGLACPRHLDCSCSAQVIQHPQNLLNLPAPNSSP